MCTLLHKHIQNIFAMIDIILFLADYGDSFADSSHASWLVTLTVALASWLSLASLDWVEYLSELSWSLRYDLGLKACQIPLSLLSSLDS